jgi:hypothetical protein
MLQTGARIVMMGLTAVTLGALGGWVLIDKLNPKPAPTTAMAATVLLPAAPANADEPVGPKRQPAAAPAAPKPAAATPAPAPTRVAAPAPTPAPAAEPAPAADAPGKPHIHIDKDRGRASLEYEGSRISAGTDGKMQFKLPNGEFRIDPDDERIKVRGPGGISFDIDW